MKRRRLLELGSTAALVLATTAVAGGFLYLRSINEALVRALDEADVPEVKSLLRKGVGVQTKGKQTRHTPLMILAYGGETVEVKWLLLRGARVNEQSADGYTALMWAAAQGHAEIVKLLLAHGADPLVENSEGHEALTLAGYGGFAAGQVRESGGHPDRYQLGDWEELFRGYDETMRVLERAMRERIRTATGAEAQRLKQKQRDEDLVDAVQHRDVGRAKVLVRQGASHNATDGYSERVLMLAAHKGDTLFVRELLARGADPRIGTATGTTALHDAAGRGSTDIIRLLIQAGAEVDAPDQFGRTALMHASIMGRTAATRELLAHGANVHLRDEDDYTALNHARGNRRPAVVRLLEQAGARFTRPRVSR
jgi:uncharacterized protein